MNVDCQHVQELLAESGGRLDRLPDPAVQHVHGCSECARVAEQERLLAEAFAAALPPVDEALTERIMEAVHERHRMERLLRVLPLAASVFIVLGVLVLLGGVPGGGLIATVPGTAATGGLGLVGAAAAWVRSVLLAAGALSNVVPWWLTGMSLLAVAGGLLAGYRLLRRLGARVR